MLTGGSYALGLLAGLLSTLSPCVLPLLPIVLGTAVTAHRYGAAMLALGLALSFVAIGLFVATIGFAIGLDLKVFRLIGAVLLIGFGLLLLSPGLQDGLAALVGSFGGRGQVLLARLNPHGLRGQFLLGLLLGIVWSPCVGPTLGAAATLAAQRQNLAQVAGVMLLFGIGAALPMALIGLLGREALLRWRGRLLLAGQVGKKGLGMLMVALGVLIVSGFDREIETLLVNASPAWLTAVTTRF
ncbi:MAG: cytochrome c biogenesis protein CcdA [Dongiaceae bacterium]